MKLLKSLTMLDDQTIEIVFHDDAKIDLVGLKAAFRQLDEYTDKRLKKLIISGLNTQISHEARKFGHQEARSRKDKIIAEAMVVHKLHQKMVANFYSAFIKGLYPVKYFTDVDEAKKWLADIQN